jgi:hypothetical protein
MEVILEQVASFEVPSAFTFSQEWVMGPIPEIATESNAPINANWKRVIGRLKAEGEETWAGFIAPVAFGLERGFE